MYSGACHALSDPANPDRFAQAAQSLRELLEKLPLRDTAEVLNAGIAASESLKGIVTLYEYATKTSASYDAGERRWEGSIDGPLAKMLSAVDEAATRTPPKNKRARSAAFLREQEPTGEPLPHDLEQQFTTRWLELDAYFQAVAHHRRQVSPDEFSEQMHRCTVLLLEILGPTPLSTLDALDRLIQEAENDA